MIDKQEIERLKATTDLVALLRSRGIKLQRQGKQLVGLCPFHNDREPSLLVDPNKQLWNCLGACGEGGDVYQFVMKADAVDFREAHRRLGGSAPGSESPASAVKPGGVDELHWLERAVAHYHQTLLQTPAAQEYLHARGITAPEAILSFRLGYCDGSLLEKLSAAGKAALQGLGVVQESGRELLLGCVVFPLVRGATNQAVSLYGRHSERRQHLYLPGERRGLFNPAGARNTEEVVIAESVIDAAALWSVGVRNVLALYGTNGLTDEIIGHLQENRVRRAALLLDADDAGRSASSLITARLASIHITARSVELPAKDAAEFIAEGGTVDAVRACLATSATPTSTEPVVDLKPVSSNAPAADGALAFTFDTRAYRVRGLSANGLDRLKVNLRLQVGPSFHLDTFDLYAARSRSLFAQAAAKLCQVEERQVSADLLQMIERLEAERLDLRRDNDHKPEAAMTREEEAAALAYLRAPDLCHRIVDDFRRCGLVGESASMLTAYLGSLSRKLAEPFGILIVARSGAGKSSLQDALCNFTPPEDLVRVTRLTGQALFYKDPYSLQRKVLAIAEEEGAQQAVYSLRTLASDQRLAIAATRTDPATGKLHTEHYEVFGPVVIVITTTSAEAFDEETRSRFVLLTMDESRQQTQAILERQRQRYTLAGAIARAQAEPIRKLHHHAQRLLRPLEVINPFVEYLTYPDDRLIHRREQKKYLALINTIALLHQHQRELKRITDGDTELEYVEVTLDDIALANELASQVLTRSLDEVAPPVRGMYREFRSLCKQRAQESDCRPDEVQLTRREIREATGWSDWQVRTYCQQLVEMEYLYLVSGQNGKRMVYQLAFYDQAEDDAPGFGGLVDVEQLREQLKEKSNPEAKLAVSTLTLR